MVKKIGIILIIMILTIPLVGYVKYNYEFDETLEPVSSEASYTYEDTWPIVEDHYNDFNYDTFDSFMASKDTSPGSGDGFYNYVRSLGGVFAKYVDKVGQPDFKVTSIGEYQEVALYTWGLMAIWGFDYSNGVHATHWYWCNGKNGPFYPTFSRSRDIGWPGANGTINSVCSGEKWGKERMTTCCNVAIEAFMKTAGLYDDWEPVNLNLSVKDLRIGDYIRFRTHVVIVGEINPAENTITLYDGGSRFIRFDRTI